MQLPASTSTQSPEGEITNKKVRPSTETSRWWIGKNPRWPNSTLIGGLGMNMREL